MKIDELLNDMKDTLVLTHSTARDVLTDNRTEIIEEIQNEEIKSVKGLVDKLDRNFGGVSRDLKILYESDVIDFEKGKGGGKKPVMKHQTVIVEPITYSIGDKNED